MPLHVFASYKSRPAPSQVMKAHASVLINIIKLYKLLVAVLLSNLADFTSYFFLASTIVTVPFMNVMFYIKHVQYIVSDSLIFGYFLNIFFACLLII